MAFRYNDIKGSQKEEVRKLAVRLPLGIDNFKKIRSEDYYYIDKTLFIRELLANPYQVNLITRPRRFGKTLTMSMLADFFDLQEESAERFEHLAISGERELCAKWMNQCPVIFLTLKSVEGHTFDAAYGMLKELISDLYIKHEYLESSENVSTADLPRFRRLKNGEGSEAELKNAIYILMRMMYFHFGQPVILLVDEYDVPLSKANESGYDEQMLDVLRGMLGKVLKSNEFLQFAVVTGCLKIAKESIFTGTNNFVSDTILNQRFDEYFGFTAKDVSKLLEDTGLSEHDVTMKEWYDGYRFGAADVYCPWDVLRYTADLQVDPKHKPEAYWANTSGNHIVKRLIRNATKTTQRELEELIAGGTVFKKINQEITYRELDQTIDNMWSVLFSTGYLTQRRYTDEGLTELAIPNREVRQIFTTQIMEWFYETVRENSGQLERFYHALKTGDAEEVQKQFDTYLMSTISIRDTAVRKEKKENFYHGILHGLLNANPMWIAKSNVESGEGYSDLLAEIDSERIGIVIEVKYAEDNRLDAVCEEAMAQIEEKQYAAKLLNDGMEQILLYGIACYKKHCKVRSKKYMG